MINLADEFPLDDDLIYLNHAAVGVWPRRTRDAVVRFADENMYRGAAEYPNWLKSERRLRGRLQRLINAPSVDDIALVKNTSEALSLIAYGLAWRAGDNVVISDQEFPSNRIVWESLASQGVELRVADISGDDPEAAMIACCDARTRLLSVSSVQYGTGLRMMLPKLGKYCREQQILFCVDAIQSLGALCFDAVDCCADFVVADAHKWMLGPEGIALFYTSAEARSQLKLLQYGWHMVERAGDFDAKVWRAADSARRFEPGSPNMVGIHALDASLSLFEELGMEQIQDALLERCTQLLTAVADEHRLELLTSDLPDRASGIITFRCRGLDAAEHAALWPRLMRQGLICAPRGGGIRLSPHFYSSFKAEAVIRQIITVAGA